ncbi:hypothetical protein [Streptomyces sp. NPDC101206]|uniref:hypothetical protein n=1 Tax=Streptomyces sp. NPDC101206 TaxID=3366128 RepID=UPI003822B510
MACSPKGLFQAGHTWVATIAGLGALALSVYNFLEAQKDPTTEVMLPHSLKVEAETAGISVFLQPTVFTRFGTEDTELVKDVRLRLRLRSPGPAVNDRPDFYWGQVVKWTARYEPTDAACAKTGTSPEATAACEKALSAPPDIWWEFESEPAPFVVTQSAPQRPSIQFRTHNWKLTPGRYDGGLTLVRASTRSPLERTFCLVLEAGDAERIKQRKTIWWEFRNDVRRSTDHCYRWYE